MADNNNQQQMQLQIEIKPEMASGQYSNLALITHSHAEFVLDFIAAMPGFPKAMVNSRVVMAPENAKRLLAALNENVMKYEQEFGKINLGQPVPSTIAPFGRGSDKGEA